MISAAAIPAAILLSSALLSAVPTAQDRHAREAPATGADGPAGALVFAERHVRFPDRYQGGTIEQRFAFSNPSDRAITLTDYHVASGQAELVFEPPTIVGGGRGAVLVRQPLGARLGQSSFRYAVITDEPGAPRYRLSLSGFVQSAYDPEMPSIEFGRVDRDTGSAVELRVGCREVERLELVPSGRADGPVDCGLLRRGDPPETSMTLQCRLIPGAPQGYLAGTVEIATNVRHQPILQVPYRAVVQGDVVADENPLELGVVYAGTDPVRRIELRSRSGAPFEIERIEDPTGRFAFAIEPCLPGGGDACRRIVLRLATGELAPLSGRLQVRLAGDPDPIALRYSGLVVAPGTQIREIVLPDPVPEDGS